MSPSACCSPLPAELCSLLLAACSISPAHCCMLRFPCFLLHALFPLRLAACCAVLLSAVSPAAALPPAPMGGRAAAGSCAHMALSSVAAAGMCTQCMPGTCTRWPLLGALCGPPSGHTRWLLLTAPCHPLAPCGTPAFAPCKPCPMQPSPPPCKHPAPCTYPAAIACCRRPLLRLLCRCPIPLPRPLPRRRAVPITIRPLPCSRIALTIARITLTIARILAASLLAIPFRLPTPARLLAAATLLPSTALAMCGAGTHRGFGRRWLARCSIAQPRCPTQRAAKQKACLAPGCRLDRLCVQNQ